MNNIKSKVKMQKSKVKIKMKNESIKNPPKIARRLLNLLINKYDHDSLIGDFDEMYKLNLEKNSKIKANFWYFNQFLKIFPSLIRSSVLQRSDMFRNYLKVSMRNLKRQKIFSLINVSGLAIGITCCILILLWVYDELSFDRFFDNSDNIFRVISRTENPGKILYEAGTALPLGPALKEEIPEIKDFTRFFLVDNRIVKYKDNIFNEDKFVYADASLFDIFSYTLSMGNIKTALSDPFSVIISEEMRKKYFGKKSPIGEILNIENRHDFTVTGVIDIPENSHLQFDFICPFSYLKETGWQLNQWWWTGYHTYVLLDKNIDYSDVNEKLAGFVKKHNKDSNSEILLQPLAKVHLYSSNIRFDNLNYFKSSVLYLKIFAPLALVVLIVACINFMNLSTARSSGRAKEVGLRKVIGADRYGIIKQFFGESIVLSFLALFFALILSYISLPYFNLISGKEITITDLLNPVILSGIIVITFAAGIISGSYPSFYLSVFQPADVLKGTFRTGKKAVNFRRILVLLQFSITAALLIGTFVVYNQMNFIKNKDLGFNKEHLIYIETPRNFKRVGQYEPFKNLLLQNPDIVNVSSTMQTPANIGLWVVDNIDWDGKPPDKKASVTPVFADYDFFKTFGMEIIKGRPFSREYPNDETKSFLINEEAAKLIGSREIIGKRFSLEGDEGTIIGVVKNFHHRSLHDKIEPLIFKFGTGTYIWIKIRPENFENTMDYIKNSWNSIITWYPFEYRYFDRDVEELYRSESRLNAVFKCFTGLAIFISCIGLLDLSVFIADQRKKEIGIRKVLGASIQNVLRLLFREFVILVFTANLIAWPVAYFIMNTWLRNFVFRININPVIFLISALITLLIAIGSVSYQSIKASAANPVNSIRNE